MISSLATDSGQLEFKEFKDFYKEYKGKHRNNEQAILNAFQAFDKNGNGFIEANELKCKPGVEQV